MNILAKRVATLEGITQNTFGAVCICYANGSARHENQTFPTVEALLDSLARARGIERTVYILPDNGRDNDPEATRWQ